MRRIVLDTETTGLDWKTGDRVVEIGCVELLGRELTGQRFHAYLNPGRLVAESERIHGLSDEFLAGQPKFEAVVDEFSNFVRNADLIIHNADFDLGFLNNELALAGRESMSQLCGEVIDTLKEARNMRPGKKNNLNALCSEFGIDNSNRQLHGALMDAELLAEVYLAMTRGQNSLDILFDMPPVNQARANGEQRPALNVLWASAAELSEHQRVLGEVAKDSKGKCLWQLLDSGAQA